MNSQTQRIWNFITQRPNVDIPAPVLNQVAAGEDGMYVSSISKRISEARKMAQEKGADFFKSRDEWNGKQRNTWYRFTPEAFSLETEMARAEYLQDR